MHQKIELEAEQHAEHIHAAANPSNESAAETVGTARALDTLFYGNTAQKKERDSAKCDRMNLWINR